MTADPDTPTADVPADTDLRTRIRELADEYVNERTPKGLDNVLRHNARRVVALRFLALVGDETPGTGDGA